jgi:signal transduction histidine kinase
VQEILGLIGNSVERFKKTISIRMEIARLQQESDQPVTQVDPHQVTQEVVLDLAQPIAAWAQVEVDSAGCPSVRFAEKHLRSVVYRLHDHAEGSGIGLYMVKKFLSTLGAG